MSFHSKPKAITIPNAVATLGTLRSRLIAAMVVTVVITVLPLETARFWSTFHQFPLLRVTVAITVSLTFVVMLATWLARVWGRQGDLRDTPDATSKLVADIEQLGASARDVQSSTDKLSSESQLNAAHVNDTSATVDEMVESVRKVAQNTADSAQVAEEARQSAAIGAQAVTKTIKGMQRIRKQVQSTSKRFKQLGESSQQIGEIVQLISDVAERTSLLALNASIQAAMAGEAGEGFGVVAEEVERLSQRCNEAAKQMTKFVKSTRSETSDAIAAMEESISEVVKGSKLARQAGHALADIDAVSNRLAELINSISDAAKQQVRGGVLVSRSIAEIAAVTHESADGVHDAAESIRQLVSRADELRSAVRSRSQLHPEAGAARYFPESALANELSSLSQGDRSDFLVDPGESSPIEQSVR